MSTAGGRPSIDAAGPPEGDEGPDADLIPAFALVWVASLVRVVGGFARNEVFGTEATLALLMVIVLPLLLTKAHHRLRA